MFQVSARIEGLPQGPCEIAFPGSKQESLIESGRISRVEVATNSATPVAAAVDSGWVVLAASNDDLVTITYQLKSEAYHRLTETSYLDPIRGLLHPREILLQIGCQRAESSTLSFVLPPGWRATPAGALPGDGSFHLDGEKKLAPFYLGDASATTETVGQGTCVVDTGWQGPVEEVLQASALQLRYRNRVATESDLQPLLVVFVPVPRDGRVPAVHSLNAPRLTVITEPQGIAGRGATGQELQRNLARSLLQSYLPLLGSLEPSSVRTELEGYLSLKACLRTGVVTRTEFFDAAAAGLWDDFHDSRNELPATPASPERTKQTVSTSEGLCSPFLLDLALSFYGDSTHSLEEFISGRPVFPVQDIVWETEMRRRLQREGRAAKVFEASRNSTGLEAVGAALRPFGLLFERRTLPAFPFELTESFQVALLKTREAHGLQLGDRVVAINDRRLAMPDDLLKFRSRFSPGQDVQISVERSGFPLKLKVRVSENVWLKLEAYKLADADKREKLESFLRAKREIISH